MGTYRNSGGNLTHEAFDCFSLITFQIPVAFNSCTIRSVTEFQCEVERFRWSTFRRPGSSCKFGRLPAFRGTHLPCRHRIFQRCAPEKSRHARALLEGDGGLRTLIKTERFGSLLFWHRLSLLVALFDCQIEAHV